MSTYTIVKILGGLGLFLLGIHHLTEGLKGLAGDSLRRTLQKFVSGRFSAITSGVLFTVASQSSTATILAVMGFVSAGLITFSQAVGINMGATLGTTSTPWIVALFGLRFRITAFALPSVGVGALLWIIGRGRTRSLGAILAGFGLLFTGIDYLQTGMQGISWDLEAFAGTGIAARWILAGVGIVMTIVMQSSSAAAATTLVALDAGSLTFEQGCAMVVGQSVGTAATSALAAIGGSVAVRRTALAQIIFSVVVGVLGILLLGPLAAAADWVGAQLNNPDGVLALAAFSSIFKLAGIVVFYPWLDQFSRFIERISGTGSETAVSHLEPVLARAGGAAALDAAWGATLEVAHIAVDAVRARLAGEPVTYKPQAEAVEQIDNFLASLSLDAIEPQGTEPRLVRLCHALDHLKELDGDLTSPPASRVGWEPPVGFERAARALASWLDATKDPKATPDSATFMAVEEASRQLSAERESGRTQLLEDVAFQRTSTAMARVGLDALRWADDALYQAWHLAESLRTAFS